MSSISNLDNTQDLFTKTVYFENQLTPSQDEVDPENPTKEKLSFLQDEFIRQIPQQLENAHFSVTISHNTRNDRLIQSRNTVLAENQILNDSSSEILDCATFSDFEHFEAPDQSKVACFDNSETILAHFDDLQDEQLKHLNIEPLDYIAEQEVVPRIKKSIDPEIYNRLSQDEPCKSQKLISWSEFRSLVQHNFSLRYESSIHKTEELFNQGSFGDALAISKGISSFLYSIFQDGRLQSIEITHFFRNERDKISFRFFKTFDNRSGIREIIDRNMEYILNLLSPKQKEILLEAYEEALRSFIYKNVFKRNHAAPPQLDYWKDIWEANLSTSSCFIILENAFELDCYDFDTHYQIGKFGTEYISRDRVRAIFFPPSNDTIIKYRQNISDVTEQVIAVQKGYISGVIKKILGFLSEAKH